jgi:hypothetical protein
MMQGTQQTVTLRPSNVVGVMVGIVVFLASAHLAALLVRFVAGHPNAQGLVSLFDLYQENNIPTFFSSTILLFSSCLIAIIWVFKRNQGDSFARYWAVLAVIFLYLSMDEASSIHEWLSLPTMRVIPATGLLCYSWVIPATILLVVFEGCYLKFLFHLTPKTRWLLIVAGVVYVAGTIGMELLGGRHHELYGIDNMSYGFLVMLEESLEMIGIVVFVYALLDYMRANAYTVSFCFRPDDSSTFSSGV